jgi:hypothetical protein
MIFSRSSIWVCSLVAAALSQESIYVSPTGSDSAAGTQSAPYATLTRARNEADSLKASGPVTVWLLGGTYYLQSPVTFGPSNSGTAAAPITYQAFPGEKPIISGGIPVTTAWTTYSGSIMVTTIAESLHVDQLFLNGTRMVLARYPNFNANSVDLDGGGAYSSITSRASKWKTPTQGPGYIRALNSSGWGGESFIISSVNGTTVNTTWVGDNGRGDAIDQNHALVENIFEELDTVNEWYYNKTTGQLFFWPPAGTNLNTSTVELASQPCLLRFVGTDSVNTVKYVTFNGIDFTETYRTLFDGTYTDVLASDWTIVRNGTVFMEYAQNVTFENCKFDQVGGNGVFMSGYNRHNVIYNNVFNGGGASPVCLFGLDSAVRCPSTSYAGLLTSCSDRTPGPLTNKYPAYCMINNNLITHFGRFEKQPAGVAMSVTLGDTILHNTIDSCPRAGICCCDGDFGGHLIAYNWVYADVQETSDHGPFNAWGRDRNWVDGESDTGASLLDAFQPTTIRMNRLEGPGGMFGIDLDDGSTNYYQADNLLIGGGSKMQWGRYRTFVNNVVVRGGYAEFHGTWTSSHDYGEHNIFIGPPGQTCIYQECCFSSGSIPPQIEATKISWDSNDVYCVAGTPTLSTWSEDYGCGTAEGTWAQWIAAGLDAHSVLTSPNFTDTTKSWVGVTGVPYHGDFSVQTGSPALAMGFQNFVMDSFGVMGTPGPGIVAVKKTNEVSSLIKSFYYRDRRLMISYDGSYRVVIVTVSGRTLATFNGKGTSEFALDPKRIRTGSYIAVIHSTSGLAARRFVVSE